MLPFRDSMTPHDEWVLLNSGPADMNLTTRHALPEFWPREPEFKHDSGRGDDRLARPSRVIESVNAAFSSTLEPWHR
jgi:hypothetical protein